MSVMGYDTALSQSLALYRMLTVLMCEETEKKELFLHMSSSVAKFERGTKRLNYWGLYGAPLSISAFLVLYSHFHLIKVGKPILIRRKL